MSTNIEAVNGDRRRPLTCWPVVAVAGVLASVLFYPKPLFVVAGRYSFYAGYAIWPIGLLVLPKGLTLGSHRAVLSRILWVLRVYIVVDFLVVTLWRSSVYLADLYSMAGVLLPTFLYEVGFVLQRKRLLFPCLRVVSLAATAWSMPAAVRALGAFLAGGPSSLVASVGEIRAFTPGWPNGVGMLMATAFLIQIHLPNSSSPSRLIRYVPLFILLLTLSRTAVIMLGIGLLIRGILRKDRLRTLLSLVMVCLVAAFVFQGKGESIQNSLLHTATGRIGRWAAAMEVVGDNPLLGVGFRSFDEATGFYMNKYTGTWVRIGSAHNDFVDLAIRGGVIYVLLFMLLLTGWAYLTYRRRQGLEARAALAVVSAILAGCLFQDPLKTPSLSSVFWLLLGATSRPVTPIPS